MYLTAFHMNIIKESKLIQSFENRGILNIHVFLDLNELELLIKQQCFWVPVFSFQSEARQQLSESDCSFKIVAGSYR